MKNLVVSVIITTKNEEKNIADCLRSIKFQSYSADRTEIIVVDNNSEDGTKQIAKKYGARVFNKGPERSAQRNLGINKSKGKYIMYLDADMILSSSVIERSVERLEKGDAVALYIPEVVLGNSYWNKARRFERSFYDGTAIDCVRFITKDVFEQVGGFDLSLTGPEDWDFDKKIRGKGKVEVLDAYDFKEINDKLAEFAGGGTSNLVKTLAGLSPKAVVYHNEAKFNVKKYFEKKQYYSKSFSSYINKWGKNEPDIKKQFGFWYRYFGVFIEDGKWKKLLEFPHLVLGMFSLRFLVGISYMNRRIILKKL